MNSLTRPVVLVAGLFLLAALGLGALTLCAQDAPAPAPAPKEEAPREPAAEPAPETPKEPAAEPEKETPKPELGEPRKSPGGTVPLPRAPLLKENTRLIDIEGLIVDLKDDLKASPVPRAVFQPKDGLGYFILLENSLLQKVLGETAHGERPVRVRGTITLFGGRNYLLLDYAAVKQE